MLVVADRRIELVDALVRHELGEEGHGRRRLRDVDVEVGPCEPEDDRDLVGGGEHGIDDDAVAGHHQRERERQPVLATVDLADEVRSLVSIESAGEHVRTRDVNAA